jgi:hypothetical protein
MELFVTNERGNTESVVNQAFLKAETRGRQSSKPNLRKASSKVIDGEKNQNKY